ncbi:PBP1A family penicillin-binding protein [Devosia rhodophyticola]|uniref:peptidoglycan glycosyltransferase n=1 Tax=Devosia rhodophyticola TaxID=3026423 RepID=A0ABY7Z1C2_9HYPH|nr:PBP1A family penicillin-binding protein [Devosia rhodophyticola]WDR07197.1 PBP1A family penicillin-binding protein [Devosia rhodophyticola]
MHWTFVACLWAGIAVAGIIVYYGAQLPASNTWAVPDRPPNIRILAADGQLISNRGKTGGEAASLHELPAYVPAAVLAIEDRRFYDHFGIDPIGIARALVNNVAEGRITGGGSTITQQLAKNLFLTRDQNLGRKVQEALLAIWLEHNYSKDEILEMYLNRMFFGNNSFGIEAAAQTYFGKSARNLTLGEAAMLAGSLQAPSRLNPKSNTQAVSQRQSVVLQAMADEGYITQAEARAATIDPNQKVRTKIAGGESYVADWVESLMQSYLGDVNEDVIVSTTIDWDLQKEAEFVLKEAVARDGAKRGFSQGALVSMDTEGYVRAMVGGVDYQASQYNRAVTSRRQPGSTFKPFVYLAAMEKGYTPDTVAEDAQFDYKGWSPRNSNNKYVGPVTLRQALTYSINTVAARLAIDVTPQVVIDTAMRLGISSPMQAVPSIALGTQEVSLLELTGAYTPFANGGIGVIPSVITKIETPEGKVLYEASTAGPGRVIAPNIVAEMDDMLSKVVEVGSGKGANLSGWEFGGKTGTSQNSRDALFVGFTSRYVTGVWLGNDNDAKTTLYGGTVPAAIWTEFMAKAHAGLTPQGLPSGYDSSNTPIAQQIVDPSTGAAVIDPNTGQPMVQYVDPITGQPVQVQVDPATGQPVVQPGQQLGDAQFAPDGGQLIAGDQSLDGGQPLTPDQPLTPSQPLGAFDPNGAQPTPQQSEKSQRTLMDLLFGN